MMQVRAMADECHFCCSLYTRSALGCGLGNVMSECMKTMAAASHLGCNPRAHCAPGCSYGRGTHNLSGAPPTERTDGHGLSCQTDGVCACTIALMYSRHGNRVKPIRRLEF